MNMTVFKTPRFLVLYLLLQSKIPGRPTSLAVYSPLDLPHPRLLLETRLVLEIRLLLEQMKSGPRLVLETRLLLEKIWYARYYLNKTTCKYTHKPRRYNLHRSRHFNQLPVLGQSRWKWLMLITACFQTNSRNYLYNFSYVWWGEFCANELASLQPCKQDLHCYDAMNPRLCSDAAQVPNFHISPWTQRFDLHIKQMKWRHRCHICTDIA